RPTRTSHSSVSFSFLVGIAAQPPRFVFVSSHQGHSHRLHLLAYISLWSVGINRLLKYLQAHDDFVEPKLEDLLTQLKEISGSLGDWLIGHLTNRFSSLSSPDDLANLFRILGGTESALIEANQVVLDPNSHLGMFIRRCVLTFNILSFEGVCHLLTNIGNYCKEALSSCLPYEGLGLDDSGNDLDTLSAYENMELENIVFQKVTEEIQATKQASAQISFHLHTPKALSGLVEGMLFFLKVNLLKFMIFHS
ncbi:Anaphase-promoting complex subunit 5, partial [Linum perenne]